MFYTIRSESEEGTYFLVNGWYRHFSFWIREKDFIANPAKYFEKVAFKKASTAKASLTKLLKIMPDYSTDIFTLCEIYENGTIREM